MTDVGGLNQTPPFEDVDLFGSDVALTEAVARAGLDAGALGLSAFGRDWGSAESFELGRLANENPPRLRTFDARGERLDRIDFHPAWHALMQKSTAAGLHASTWEGVPQTARAARLFIAYQVESGHICPITMTHAAMAALAAEPAVAARWRAKILPHDYDSAFRPWWEKRAVTLGMGMTERQGGTDVRANITQAVPQGDHYAVTGHKWFMSAPMCDAFLVLAQAPGGLTCFLMSRFRPDGSVNGLRFQRLKDKLGNRSNASSEVEFDAAYAERVGPEGAGVRTIIGMVQLTRLDCIVASAALMRFGLAQAVHHARHRSVFGKKLIDQPVMRALLSDLALEVEASTALAFRLARAFDEAAAGDPSEAQVARLLTPAAKYLVCKTAPAFLYETMECLGGNGYVEELPLARAYREAPVNAIWEGSGNVMALDVLRAIGRAPDAATSIIDGLEATAGSKGTSLKTALMDDPTPRARGITERLARLAAANALRDGHADLADAYVATRIDGAPHATFGTRNLDAVTDKLLARILI